MQRNANSDFGVNCAQPECVQRVQSGAIMNHDEPSLPPGPGPGPGSGRVVQRWPGGCVERGFEGARWHHLCCVVFYHWQSSKEGRGLGLPTWSRGRDTGKQA